MTEQELLYWGRVHHYPYLQLPSGGLLHGEQHWQKLLESQERTQEAIERVECWLKRLELEDAA